MSAQSADSPNCTANQEEEEEEEEEMILHEPEVHGNVILHEAFMKILFIWIVTWTASC